MTVCNSACSSSSVGPRPRRGLAHRRRHSGTRRPAPDSASGTLAAGGPFAAYSPLRALLNPNADLRVPVAADPFKSGFAAEGEAGAAAVDWSLAPEG